MPNLGIPHFSLWPVNFHMMRLLCHIKMHFDYADSRKIYVCVLASSAFLLTILFLNINIFFLNINIIILLSLGTNFMKQLRDTQRMFQHGLVCYDDVLELICMCPCVRLSVY